MDLTDRLEYLEVYISELEEWLRNKNHVTTEKNVPSLNVIDKQLELLSKELCQLKKSLKLRYEIAQICINFDKMHIHEEILI